MNPLEKRKLRGVLTRALAGIPEEVGADRPALATQLRAARTHLQNAQEALTPEFYEVTLVAGNRHIDIRVFDDGSWKSVKKGVWRESVINLIRQKNYAPDPEMPGYVKHLFAAIQEGR